MDRKGKRHVVGEKTIRSGRKRKRFGPRNRYQMEKEEPKAGTSTKPLSSGGGGGDGESDVTIHPSVGYRLVNFIAVFTAISQYVRCKECGSDVEFCESGRRGLGFKIVIYCKSCTPKEISSCPTIANAYEVNRRFIFAMRLLGISIAGSDKFCAFMDLPRPIFQSFYNNIVEQIRKATESVRALSIKKACEEEQKLTDDRCEIVDGLTVFANATWRKRGYGTLHGVITLIGYYSKKVLDICTKSAHCEECSVWKKKTNSEEYQSWLESHAEECDANPASSAEKIEPDAVIEMFRRADELHEMKYVKYMGDGDSKTYSKIVQSLPHNVEKNECMNRAQKEMGTCLNTVIWKLAPKTLWGGSPIAEVAANIATILFNDGHIGLMNALELLGVKIGETLYQYCQRVDEKRIFRAECQAKERRHEGRPSMRHQTSCNDESFMDAEELLYGLGIAD